MEIMTDGAIETNPDKIEQADVVLGLPTWRAEINLPWVLRQCAQGLGQYFPFHKAVIINADSSGQAEAGRVFFETGSLNAGKIHLALNPASNGKGRNTLSILQKALRLGAKAVAILEPDAAAVKPVWVNNLLSPVLQGYDMVTPLYFNNKYDTPLTSLLVYPLLRCTWGRRVRQPLGEERAFSRHFMQILVQEYNDFLSPQILEDNMDIWSTMVALSHGLKLCQAYLAEPKPHYCLPGRTSEQFKQVGKMLFQTLNSDSSWVNIRWSKPTAFYGLELRGSEPPYNSFFDREEIIQNFDRCRRTSRQIVSSLPEIRDLMAASDCHLPVKIDHSLWARLILESFCLYQKQPEMLSQILDALLPLFWARVLSFIEETEKMNSRQVEDFFETQCRIFEQNKEVFLNQPGRSNPAV
ncbi:MAG: hypothetical protein LBJ14_02950 [Desulfarculales bacterium]|nr:hypothetical protein [Desulfarculales bacterium]